MITSTSNPQVKMIRKLKDKKERQQTGLYYMEGIRIVLEALQMDMPLKEIILAPELITGQGIHEIYQEVQRLQIPVTEVSGDVFRSFSVKEGPQGVAAIAHQQWTDLKELIPVTGDVWVAWIRWQILETWGQSCARWTQLEARALSYWTNPQIHMIPRPFGQAWGHCFTCKSLRQTLLSLYNGNWCLQYPSLGHLILLRWIIMISDFPIQLSC